MFESEEKNAVLLFDDIIFQESGQNKGLGRNKSAEIHRFSVN